MILVCSPPESMCILAIWLRRSDSYGESASRSHTKRTPDLYQNHLLPYQNYFFKKPRLRIVELVLLWFCTSKRGDWKPEFGFGNWVSIMWTNAFIEYDWLVSTWWWWTWHTRWWRWRLWSHTCKGSSNGEKMEQKRTIKQRYMIGLCFCQPRCNRVHGWVLW